MCANCDCTHQHSQDHLPHADYVVKPVLEVDVFQDILEENDKTAFDIRQQLTEHKTLCMNLMSSPGSGKTRLLEESARHLGADRMAVIEGDMETENDADRIRAQGVPAFQISTGMACHLNAALIAHGLKNLQWQQADFLFIENVGNLICPANFDLGQHCNVVLLSVTEGADKAEKYPAMFRAADCVLITKSDFLPMIDEFDLQEATQTIHEVNPDVKIITLSSKTGDGFNDWLNWLSAHLTSKIKKTSNR